MAAPVTTYPTPVAPIPPVAWQLTGNHWLAIPCVHPGDGAIHAVGMLHRGARAAIEFAGSPDFLEGRGPPLLRPVLRIDGTSCDLSAERLTWQSVLGWLPSFTTTVGHGAFVVRGTLFAPIRRDADVPGAVYVITVENRGASEARVDVSLAGTLGHRQQRVRTARAFADAHRVAAGPGDTVLLDGTALPGVAALAVAADGTPTVAINAAVEQAPRFSVGCAGTAAAGETFHAAFYVAAAPERNGAAATVLAMRRRGWRALLAATTDALRAIEQTTGSAAIDRLVNRNLLFAYFYAVGRAVDDARFYLVRSAGSVERPRHHRARLGCAHVDGTGGAAGGRGSGARADPAGLRDPRRRARERGALSRRRRCSSPGSRSREWRRLRGRPSATSAKRETIRSSRSPCSPTRCTPAPTIWRRAGTARSRCTRARSIRRARRSRCRTRCTATPWRRSRSTYSGAPWTPRRRRTSRTRAPCARPSYGISPSTGMASRRWRRPSTCGARWTVRTTRWRRRSGCRCTRPWIDRTPSIGAPSSRSRRRRRVSHRQAVRAARGSRRGGGAGLAGAGAVGRRSRRGGARRGWPGDWKRRGRIVVGPARLHRVVRGARAGRDAVTAPAALDVPSSVGGARARALFARHFGGQPAVVVSAPGRVNLIGEHFDYNGGEVLPMAIGRRTYVAGRRRSGVTTHVVSAAQPGDGRGTFEAAFPARSGEWWDYIAGAGLELGLAGVRIPAADLAVWSDVPTAAGLSSSAALEVAGALALVELAGATLPALDIARAAWRAEVEFVGVPCGIMDQYAVSLAREGEAVHIWCDTGAVAGTPMSEPVLVFDTATPRSLRASAFETRRAECDQALASMRTRYPDLANLAAAEPAQVMEARLPAPLDRRARHVATETRRVRAVVAQLEAGGVVPGDLLLASHASLRDDFECSTAELDWFVGRVMMEAGVRGARLTGAGWGGCAIAVGDESALASAMARLPGEYADRFGHTPQAWITRAATGARVEWPRAG